MFRIGLKVETQPIVRLSPRAGCAGALHDARRLRSGMHNRLAQPACTTGLGSVTHGLNRGDPGLARFLLKHLPDDADRARNAGLSARETERLCDIAPGAGAINPLQAAEP